MKNRDLKERIIYSKCLTYEQLKEVAIKDNTENKKQAIFKYWNDKGYIRIKAQINHVRKYLYYLPTN